MKKNSFKVKDIFRNIKRSWRFVKKEKKRLFVLFGFPTMR